MDRGRVMSRVIVVRKDDLVGFWALFAFGVAFVVFPCILLTEQFPPGLVLMFFLVMVFLFMAIAAKRVRSGWTIVGWWIATTFCYASAPMLLEYLSGTKFYGNIFFVQLMFYAVSGVGVLLGCGAGRLGRWLSGTRYVVQTGTLCPGCGYDVRGNVSMVCPECGRAVTVGELREMAE